MNIGELFTHLQTQAARLTLDESLAATVSFNITGEEPAQWRGRVAGGRASLEEGPAENPDVTVTADGRTAIGLCEGAVNPLAAFMTGKVKVQGDPAMLGLVKGLLMGRK